MGSHLTADHVSLIPLIGSRLLTLFPFLWVVNFMVALLWNYEATLVPLEVGFSLLSGSKNILLRRAHSAYFNVLRQKVPYFNVSRQNRVVFNCFSTKQCWGRCVRESLREPEGARESQREPERAIESRTASQREPERGRQITKERLDTHLACLNIVLLKNS